MRYWSEFGRGNAAYWAARDRRFNEEGFHLIKSPFLSFEASAWPALTADEMSITEPVSATRTFFDLTSDQYNFLFDEEAYPDDWGPCYASPTDVAERIEILIDNDGVVLQIEDYGHPVRTEG